MRACLIGLGSNLGQREQTLKNALEGIAQLPSTRLLEASSLHRTRPVGGPSGQDDFVNAAARIETSLPAAELLAALHGVENSYGRNRRVQWEARTLDLDLLLYDDAILRTPDPRVPHPRMTFRPFVMAPAAEVAPQMRHPEIDASVGELWETLTGGAEAVAIIGGDCATQAAVKASLAQLAPAVQVLLGDDPRLIERVGPKLILAIVPNSETPLPPTRRPTLGLSLASTPAAGPPGALPAEWTRDILAAVECVWPSSA